MRKTLFIILFSVFIFKAYSQNEFPLLNYQLGRTIGTTIDIIKNNEGMPDSEELLLDGIFSDIYYNNRTVMGCTTDISYSFFENKLYDVQYHFWGTYTLDRWIEIYINLFNKLNDIYGKHRSDENITDEQRIEWLRRNYEEKEMLENGILFSNGWSYHDRSIRYNTRITYIDLFFSYNNELETLEIYLSYISNDFWNIRSMIEGS